MGMVTISFADLKKKISEIQPVSFNLKNKSNESLPGSFLLISIMQQWDVASSAINKTKEESAQTDYINGAVNALFCVIRLTPEDHPEKAQRLNELAFALHARFERLGNLDDLENDIIMSRHALELTPDDHPSKDLEDDIGMSQHALDLTADDDSEKLDLLGNLATSLHARFERLGNLDDLEKDIAMSQYALDLTSDNDPEKPARLSNLSLSLHARFGRLGHLADIDSAILRGQGAVELTSDGEPIKAQYLSNLAVFQLAHFGRVGDLVDIESANFQWATCCRPHSR
ncbi:hypothetical protein BT96DRAFT_973674 [Gymnopus androsaceus JB14]|uniref:Uncharacterized protein n=1 Tax=Gymnopus androsaceus JB14 TaxID=1447944 RepID=A0A6A4I0J4_9AGAR|nr:hypothetical protein BT96DRAFT_973674 [Gymnopus androsaceus JB14]